MNNDIFMSMSYGVYIVSTMDGERPTGCTANCAMQITIDPSTIAISIHHDNFTKNCIEQTKRFSISILSEESNPGIISCFGFRSGKDVNKFEKVAYEMKCSVPVVTDSCGYIICEVINTMETNTHTVFLGKVIEGDTYATNAQAMSYDYYHKVIKGKTSKNAPTYIKGN